MESNSPVFILDERKEAMNQISEFDTEAFYDIFIRELSVLTGFETRGFIKLTTIWINEPQSGEPNASYDNLDKLDDEYFLDPKDSTWQKVKSYLSRTAIDLNRTNFVASELYRLFRSKNFTHLNIHLLKEKSIKNYFKETEVKIHLPSQYSFEQNEYDSEKQFILAETIMVARTILSMSAQRNPKIDLNNIQELDISNIYFRPIPIFHLCNFVGVAYAIYYREDENLAHKNETAEHRLNQPFTYEDLVREATDALERTTVQIRMMNFYERPISTNAVFEGMEEKARKIPLLKSLSYPNFYRQQNKYAARMAKFADRLREATVRRAVSSILVDSFAHNYGAHCLVELKWYFENRFKLMDERFDVGEDQRQLNFLFPRNISRKKLARFAKKDPFQVAINKSESANRDHYASLNDVIRYMDKNLESSFLKFYDQKGDLKNNHGYNNYVAAFPIPIDFALYPFFQSLRDKAAFWSGVSRDITFSGLTIKWSDLLVRDFVGNPLFLGTIAHSEGINRIRFYVEVYDQEGNQQISGELAKINLDVIRKERFDPENRKIAEANMHEEPENDRYSSYAFVRPGEKFEEITNLLENLAPVFLPNGIVGQQALYTILENTLRNIKHYKHILKEIRKTGIYFYISIQPAQFIERATTNDRMPKEAKLYKVGTWLHHEQILMNEGGHMIIPAHYEQLKQRIIYKTGKPRLGGSSQDKVCAAMLMNNTFVSVDEPDWRKAKKHYYPYIFPTSEPFQLPEERSNAPFKPQDIHFDTIYNAQTRATVDDLPKDLLANKKHLSHDLLDDIEVKEALHKLRQQKYQKAKQEYQQRIQAPNHTGLVKKYFHLWIAKDCLILKPGQTIDNFQHHDNSSRFRIVAVSTHSDREFKLIRDQLRKQGVIRIVKTDPYLLNLQNEGRYDEMYEYAMKKWLSFWLPFTKNITGIKLRKAMYKGTSASRKKSWFGVAWLEHHDEAQIEVYYLNTPQLREQQRSDPSFSSVLSQLMPVVTSHSPLSNTENSLGIRSHCSFITDLYENKYNYDSDDETKDDISDAHFTNHIQPLRLLEIIQTRVVMVDNRLHDRLPQSEEGILNKYDTFKSYLRLEIYPENGDLFTNIEKRKRLLTQTNFLVIHLSLIEAIIDQEGRRYSEDRLSDFFTTEIKEFYTQHIDENGLPANFIFVITSGRGNDAWVDNVKELNVSNITFRPIEDLLNAIEDGLTHKDDFQVKYNLSQVFFGS